VSKEAYLYGESDLFTWQKRPSEISIPEVCVCVSVKRGLPYGKRDLLYAQKRPTNVLAYLRYARVSKETYYMAKETYYMAKETYSYGKRGLLTSAYLSAAPLPKLALASSWPASP